MKAAICMGLTLNVLKQCKDDPTKWPGDCPKDCPYFQRYCRVKPVDDPDFILSIPFSLPTQKWLVPYVTAWIVSKKLDGSIDRLVDENVKKVFCPGDFFVYEAANRGKIYRIWQEVRC